MKKTFLTLSAAALILLAACNNEKKENTETPAPPTETTTPTSTTDNVSAGVAEVTLNAGDDMKYDINEIKVKEGQTVKVTLHHTGKAPVTAMGHNFVLLEEGVDLAEFAAAAIKAKDNDYIPKDKTGDVIAHTKTIGGGETTQVEFKAPPKGTYEYLCSFPGHSALMKGKFIVE